MQCSLRAAARRLAKGPSLLCSSRIGAPPLLLPSLRVPEAPHAGLPVRMPRGRLIISSRSLSSDPNSNPATNPAPAGRASAPPGAEATGEDEPASFPPYRLMSFGGPAKSKLLDPDDFFLQNEVLQPVPMYRLITPAAGRQYLFPDLGRQLFRSSLLIPFLAHERGCSSGGVFKEGNVGIIEGLNVFGLNELFPYQVDEITEDIMRTNFQEAYDYAVNTFEKAYGKDVLKQFPPLLLLGDVIKASPLNPKKIINNVALLSRESTVILIQRMYDFLLKVVPNQKVYLYKKACSIYAGMPYITTSQSSQKDEWVPKVHNDTFLITWVDKWDRPYIIQLRSDGPGLLKLHRHGCCAHWLENELHHIIRKLKDPIHNQSFVDNPLIKADVHHHFEYNFPEFPTVTYDQFEREGLDYVLNTDDLFYMPLGIVEFISDETSGTDTSKC